MFAASRSKSCCWSLFDFFLFIYRHSIWIYLNIFTQIGAIFMGSKTNKAMCECMFRLLLVCPCESFLFLGFLGPCRAAGDDCWLMRKMRCILQNMLWHAVAYLLLQNINVSSCICIYMFNHAQPNGSLHCLFLDMRSRKCRILLWLE